MHITDSLFSYLFPLLSHHQLADLGKEQAESIHNEWLHRVANLTISAAPYNSHYSNATFSEKLSMDNGYKQSGIKMTQRLAQNTSWGLPELEARCKELTIEALSLWPYVSTSYTAPEKQYDEYTLDEGISFTGLNLVKYRFRGIEHSALSWTEMFCADRFTDSAPSNNGTRAYCK